MRIGRSTKAVLTVIAGCCVWLVFLVSLVAQTQRGVPDSLVTVSPTIMSGSDIGFRLERTVDGIAVGKVVIRVDGRWVDTAAPVTIVR